MTDPINPHEGPKYEADGSRPLGWDPNALAEHDDEQVRTNLTGSEQARQELADAYERAAARSAGEQTVTDDDQVTVEEFDQDELPMGQEPKPEKKSRTLVAFGKFVKPEMYDIFGDYDLSDVKDQEIEWMQPERLHQVLFDPKQDKTETPLRVGGVALNPYEYRIIPRSPDHIGRSAKARVLGVNELDDQRIAASERGEGHVLESYADNASQHLEKLQEQLAMVKLLDKEASMAGFAHQQPERMKELFGAAWNEFTNILDVVHVHRGWSTEQRTRAEAAMIFYLTTGSQRQRVGHWQKMLSVGSTYLQARAAIFNNRVSNLERKLQTDESVS